MGMKSKFDERGYVCGHSDCLFLKLSVSLGFYHSFITLHVTTLSLSLAKALDCLVLSWPLPRLVSRYQRKHIRFGTVNVPLTKMHLLNLQIYWGP